MSGTYNSTDGFLLSRTASSPSASSTQSVSCPEKLDFLHRRGWVICNYSNPDSNSAIASAVRSGVIAFFRISSAASV
jgi:hypothetical protein